MKKYCLWLAVCVMFWNSLFGEIKNGYGLEIDGVRASLKSLTAALKEDDGMSVFQKAQIKGKITRLLEYVTYYELTEELLVHFRTIAPDLYNEIDSIKNIAGQPVDVFVKFAAEHEMALGAYGTTNLAHDENDNNVYTSEYGPGTVSVKIASVNKSLSLLAHEFGHVKYQVPNLASYYKFYSTTYLNNAFNSRYIGHNSNDPSGQKAIEYENMFRSDYLLFVRATSITLENPQALLVSIRKSVVKNGPF